MCNRIIYQPALVSSNNCLFEHRPEHDQPPRGRCEHAVFDAIKGQKVDFANSVILDVSELLATLRIHQVDASIEICDPQSSCAVFCDRCDVTGRDWAIADERGGEGFERWTRALFISGESAGLSKHPETLIAHRHRCGNRCRQTG